MSVMKPPSKNPRARAARYYHNHDIIPMSDECPFTGDISDHISRHKPEQYGMLAQLANPALERTLQSRDSRGHYGLVDVGMRAVTEIPNEKMLMRMLQVTMHHDVDIVIEENPELISAIEPLLDHVHEFDETIHRTSLAMLRGGVNTMLAVASTTYTVLRSPPHDLDHDTVRESWQALNDAALTGVKEIMSFDDLPIQSLLKYKVYEVNETGLGRFCAEAIKLSPRIDNRVPDRDTIGCPLTFRPDLIKAFWEWFNDLRQQIK